MMLVSFNSNMMGATSGAGNAYSTEPHELPPGV